MGNGCLKPTPRTGQIYIDCINKIYEQVKQITQKQEDKTSPELYQKIKQLIQKKGWLRKLMDNLTSHRQSISQAALHNFRLMTQSRGKIFKVTGLVVIDYIIVGVLKDSGLTVSNNTEGNANKKEMIKKEKVQGLVLKMGDKERQVNAISQYEESEQNSIKNKLPTSRPQGDRTYNLNEQQQIKLNSKKDLNQKQHHSSVPSLQLIANMHNDQQSEAYNYNKNYQSISLSNYTNNAQLINNPSVYSSYLANQMTSTHMNSLMLREIYNVKFSNIFYNMLHSLVSTEDSLYVTAIHSIITYTKYHTVKNIQQQKITDLIQILLEHIQTNQYLNLSLKAYEMLLNKLKDTFLQNEIKHFINFLKIWEHSYQQINHHQKSFIKNHQQQQAQQMDLHLVENMQHHIENKLLLEKIIHKMIVSMIGSVGMSKIYQQIILVYDQHRFQGMDHFEEMIINITKIDQLKKQFYRGLYSFLLTYLAVCKAGVESMKTIKELQGESVIRLKKMSSDNENSFENGWFNRRWGSIHSVKSYESFIQDYENILQRGVKKQVVQTLRRWIKEYKFVDINELIKYNSQLFLNSFLFNIHESFSMSMNRKTYADEKNQGLASKVGTVSSAYSSLGTNSEKNQPVCSKVNEFGLFLIGELSVQFCQESEIEQRISLVNLIYDEVKTSEQEVSDQEKLVFLWVIEKLLHDQQIQSENKHIDWCQIQLHHNNKLIMKIINLMISILNKLTQKMLVKQIDHITYFLFSLFQLFTQISLPHKEIIPILYESVKLIQTIQRKNGSLIILAFVERMVKAVPSDLEKSNFFYTWDLILNCQYLLLTSTQNYNRQNTKSHLNEIYILITLNEQLKFNSQKLNETQIQEKIIEILVKNFAHLNDKQLEEEQIIKLDLPKPQHFQNHKNFNGSHPKIYQLASIAFRDMFNRGVSRAKADFMHSPEDEFSFISQNGGFTRANSIIHEDDIRHQQKSIVDVMDMIHL